MSEPQIIVGDVEGVHNQSLKGKEYKDLSTVCVVPTRGVIPALAVERWMGLVSPMNQPFTRVFVSGMEVGEAYEHAVDLILNHPVLCEWKYLLTLEEDNLPPADGLLRLLESIEDFDAVGGLYWTKGEEGQPMCYGKPGELPEYAPWLPEGESVVPCNGIGMGFSLFRLDMFKDIERPWFKTLQQFGPDGAQLATQDLYFCGRARQAGKRIAVDTRVRVGHLDGGTGIIW